MSTSPTPLDRVTAEPIDGEQPTRPHRAAPSPRAVVALGRERQRLERVLAELTALGLDQRSEEDDLGEVASASQHPADVASETLEREVELGLLEEFRTALSELDIAVTRVEEGRYGTCERCRGPIDEERLVAVPATRFCLPCAETVEHDARWRTPRPTARTFIGAEFLADDDQPDVAGTATELSGEEAAITVRDGLAPG